MNDKMIELRERFMLDYAPCLAAAKKLPGGKAPKDFDFFTFEWLGNRPEDWTTMKVVGAVFRQAKTGPNRGLRSIKVPGTERTVYITNTEINRAARALAKKTGATQPAT